MIVISPDGLLFRLVTAEDPKILFWRGLIGAVTLALYLQFSRPGGLVAAFGRCGWPVVISALLMTAGTTFFVFSITRTTVANTLVILATMPLFGALLGRAFLGQRVPLATWLAIGVALSGILVIFAEALGAGDLVGNLYALGAAICLASNLVLIRARPSVSMLPALALSGVITAAIMLPFIAPFAISRHDLGIMAIMGVVQQSLAFGMFLTAGRYLPPAETSLFALLETVLGPLWAWLGVGEVPTGSVLLGGLLVVATLAVHSALGLRRARPLPAR